MKSATRENRPPHFLQYRARPRLDLAAGATAQARRQRSSSRGETTETRLEPQSRGVHMLDRAVDLKFCQDERGSLLR